MNRASFPFKEVSLVILGVPISNSGKSGVCGEKVQGSWTMWSLLEAFQFYGPKNTPVSRLKSLANHALLSDILSSNKTTLPDHHIASKNPFRATAVDLLTFFVDDTSNKGVSPQAFPAPFPTF